MKLLCLSFIIVLFSYSAFGQKSKPALVRCINSNELLVAYNSGVNVVYDLPSLSIKREFSPGDKKNKTEKPVLSPKKDKLIVYDSKIKKHIIWDIATGEIVLSIKSTYDTPSSFKGDDQFVIKVDKSFNVYSTQTGELVGNLDELDLLPYSNIRFSASGNLLANYSAERGMVIDLINNNDRLDCSLNAEKGDVLSAYFSKNEDSITFHYQEFLQTGVYKKTFPTRNKIVPESNYSPPKSSQYFLYEVQYEYAFTDRESIFIPLGKDYSFRHAVISPNKKWAIILNNKGTIVVYDIEDTENIERSGKVYGQPKEVTRISTSD